MRRIGPVVLFLLIFLWPPLMAFLLTWVAIAVGCAATGSESCSVVGLNIGWAIESLLGITWNFPLFGWFPVMWLLAVLGALMLIYLRFRGYARLLWGLLSIWYLPIAPSILGLLCVARLAEMGGCEIRDRGANDCLVFGTNMGDVFSTVPLLSWFALIVVPVSLFISLVYGVFIRLHSAK